MKEEEGLYYPLSENKGADQLPGYHKAGLRLCFCICKSLVFSCSGSNKNTVTKLIQVNVLKKAKIQFDFVV